MQTGQTWCLLGPNGTGKTTLLHALAGLRAADAGEVRLNDRPLADFRGTELACLRSILFQHPQEIFPVSVAEMVLSGRHPHLPRWGTETAADLALAREMLTQVDLAGFTERDLATLSGGERQRVAIATTLVQQAPLRLFDEPTNHLDLKHQQRMLQLACDPLDKLNIVVLQDLNQAWRHADHALLLSPDGSALSGGVREMLTVERLEPLFDCRIDILRDGERQVFIGG